MNSVELYCQVNKQTALAVWTSASSFCSCQLFLFVEKKKRRIQTEYNQLKVCCHKCNRSNESRKYEFRNEVSYVIVIKGFKNTKQTIDRPPTDLHISNVCMQNGQNQNV